MQGHKINQCYWGHIDKGPYLNYRVRKFLSRQAECRTTRKTATRMKSTTQILMPTMIRRWRESALTTAQNGASDTTRN